MNVTDYVLDIIASNPDVQSLSLQVECYVDTERLPDGVTWAPWEHDWSEGYAANGVLVVRFRA